MVILLTENAWCLLAVMGNQSADYMNLVSVIMIKTVIQ